MLVNTKEMLRRADQGRYAVGGFNITALDTALAIFEAAEAEASPVILQITKKTIDYMGLDVAYAIAKTLAERTHIPISVHFDHGRNFELVQQAVDCGFPSVMLDVSRMPKEERIPFVKDFVKKAHRRGVTVEVEEDQIGGREDYVVGQSGHLTNPERAAAFIRETDCDSFAVSIGSAHGKPLPNERLDVELLREINHAVEVPLVLHGASSTPEATIREVIAAGVCKINIDTDLRLAFNKQLRRTLEQEDLYDPRDELRPTIAEVKKVVAAKIRLFGSNGKAG
jgi:fructose-bisphosphate aldolase, class II